MAYDGTERRKQDADMASMIARIDERTQIILETIPTLATRERVDAVEEKLKSHIDTHVTRGGLFAAWGGVLVALVLGILGLVKGGKL